MLLHPNNYTSNNPTSIKSNLFYPNLITSVPQQSCRLREGSRNTFESASSRGPYDFRGSMDSVVAQEATRIIVIEVIDNGVGLSADVLPRIFNEVLQVPLPLPLPPHPLPPPAPSTLIFRTKRMSICLTHSFI